MTTDTRSPAGAELTALILDLFRVSSRMVVAGDRLVADLGLTSARWQILGVLDQVQEPQTVSWIARDMGGSRQNVQRIVNDLEGEGLVAFLPNPRHRRAQLVALTDQGQALFDQAMRRQADWANTLTEDLTASDVATTRKVMASLLDQLERSER